MKKLALIALLSTILVSAETEICLFYYKRAQAGITEVAFRLENNLTIHKRDLNSITENVSKMAGNCTDPRVLKLAKDTIKFVKNAEPYAK